MSPSRKNALPELMDLRARIDRASEGIGLAVELRIGVAELEDDEGELLAKVSVKRTLLSVDCDGMDIAPGARHGEPVKEGGPITRHLLKTESTSTLHGGVNVELGASSKESPSVAISTNLGAAKSLFGQSR